MSTTSYKHRDLIETDYALFLQACVCVRYVMHYYIVGMTGMDGKHN